MNLFELGLITALTAVSMEFLAWFVHKYLMHGPLWILHRDHHLKPYGFFERNDWFFVIFSIPSALCIAYGHTWQSELVFGLGLGQGLYGMAYVLAHDIFIHDRFKLGLSSGNSKYLKAIKRAHRTHHSHLSKDGGSHFGFLWVTAGEKRGRHG